MSGESGESLVKRKPWRSEKYRRFVKSLKCCVPGCPFPADDPHHEQAQGHGGMGTRPCDSRCVPICRHHHDERQHGRYGRHIWKDWRKDPEQAILETQAAWVDKYKTRPWMGKEAI